MKLKRAIAYVLTASLVCSNLLGCGQAFATSTDSSMTTVSVPTVTQGNYKTEDSDAAWNASESVFITCNGDSAQTSSQGGVTIEGSTITISQAGTYVLTGTLTDGQVIVAATAEDLVRLVLNGVTIHCTDSAAIYAKKADKTILILADGTENTVTDGEVYSYDSETEPNAAIFAKNDLSITGNGKLTVYANYHNGIATKDDLVITGGTYEITAVNHGILGKDSISVSEGTFIINAGADGIQSSDATEKGWIALDGGSYKITAGKDGIQAETELVVNGGSYEVLTGGGSAAAPVHSTAMTGRPRRAQDGTAVRPNRTTPQGEPPVQPADGTMRQPPEMPTDSAVSQPPALPTDGDIISQGEPSKESQNTKSTEDIDVTTQTSDSYKGFKAGTMLSITAGTFTMDTQDDALHANGDIAISGGTFHIATGDDAVHAEQTLLLSGGTINITQCYEGLEACVIQMTGGDVTLVASDDGVNAANGDSQNTAPMVADSNCMIAISGGILHVNAAGDGLDANGDITITGGFVTVDGPTSGGDSALDYDGTCSIAAGTFVAAGSAGMVQTPGSDSTQPSIAVTFTQAQQAGANVTLEDANGNILSSYTAAKQFQNIIFSTEALKQGQTYTISVDGVVCTTVTLENMITYVSEDGTALQSNGMGQPRGQHQMQRTTPGNATTK